MTSFAQSAAIYGAAGWPIFPCQPGGKAPLGRLAPNGFKDATSDVDQIIRWWRSEPEANIALRTGVIVDVLDIDRRLKGNGFDALERLARAGLTCGAVASAITRNGGRHFFYPSGGSTCRSFKGKYIDIKARGGYVLLPPSRVAADEGIDDAPGGYSWEEFDSESAAHPLDIDAIARFLTPETARRVRRDWDGDTSIDNLAAWVARQEEGNRNEALFWAAKKAAASGCLDEEKLIAAAMATGVSRVEATLTVRSGAKHGTAAAS